MVANPLFLDPAAGNYHISRNSPAVDMCSSGFSRDIDREMRPNDIEGVGAARTYVDDIEQTGAGRAANGDTQVVVVYPDEVEKTLGSVLESAVRIVDYGSYYWVEVDQLQLDRLNAAEMPFEWVADAGQISFGRFDFDPLSEGQPAGNTRAPQTQDGERLHFVQLRNPATEQNMDAIDSSVRIVQYFPTQHVLGLGNRQRRCRPRQTH